MKILPAIALAAGLAGLALFATPTNAETITNQTVALYAIGADAQTIYTPAQVGVSRRNFRAQCTKQQDASFCECLTAAYAQTLTPPELDLASAMMSPKAAMKARAMNAFSTPEARDAASVHIEQAKAMYEPACRQPAP